MFSHFVDFSQIKKNKTVIYFLMDENGLLYVGVTKNILIRIGSHIDSGKIFESVGVIEINAPDRLYANKVERFFIKLMDPPLNTRHCGDPMTAEETEAGISVLRKAIFDGIKNNPKEILKSLVDVFVKNSDRSDLKNYSAKIESAQTKN